MGGTNKNKDWVKALWQFGPEEKKSKEINIINNLNQTFKKTIVSENSTLDKTAFLDTAASINLLHEKVPTENNIPQQQQKLSPSRTDTRWKCQEQSKSNSAHFQRKPKLKTFYQEFKTTSLLHPRTVMLSAKYFFF